MRRIIGLLLTACLLAAAGCASAEAPDISGMSREELTALREAIDERIEEIDREEAIANANRRITFEEAEAVLFTRESMTQRPNVERLTEDAPWRTTLTWTSSDPEVATVDYNGKVTAIKGGEAEITAAIADSPYITGSYRVQVAIPVESINVWGLEEPILLRGEGEEATTQLGFSVEPEDAYCQSVTWSSSDERIATVDAEGTVTGVAPGQCVITATSAEAGSARRAPKQARYTITVIQAVTQIETEQRNIDLTTGETTRITATALPENAKNRRIEYSSDDESIATVDAVGHVTAMAPGECNIFCAATDGSGTHTDIHVTIQRKVTGIRLGDESIRLPRGQTYTIEATTEPEDATNPALIWTSSNVMVARVANGTVEAVGQGECVITCATTDGTGLTATAQVRVPTFSVPQESYTVTEKTGIAIPVTPGKSGISVQIMNEPAHFSATWNAAKEIVIIPKSAGQEALILSNPEETKDTIEILITIEDSAVFNQNSYPSIPYAELTQQAEKYDGTSISIYGQVLTNDTDEEGNSYLMVGTSGEDYSDQVIEVQCKAELHAENIPEGTIASFYGVFRNQKTYSEALQSEVSFPGLEAEMFTINQPAETETK